MSPASHMVLLCTPPGGISECRVRSNTYASPAVVLRRKKLKATTILKLGKDRARVRKEDWEFDEIYKEDLPKK